MELFDLTHQQKSILEMIRRFGDTPVSNTGGILRFKKDTRPEYLKKILNRLHYLNPGLRLRLRRDLKLYLFDSDETEVEIHDHTGLSFEETMDRIQELMNEPVFGYDKALERYHVIKRDDEVILFGIFDHLICDGIAYIRITDEVWRMANDADDVCWSKDTLPDNTFIDYLSGKEGFEENIGKGAEEYIAKCSLQHLNYPVKREGGSGEAATLALDFEEDLYESISDFCDREGLSFEQIYEAALFAIYHHITGENLISIGRVLIGRRKKTMQTVGMFTNTLPLVMEITGKESFKELGKKIKRAEFQMLSYSSLDPEKIRKANRINKNLYDTTITYRPSKRLPLKHELCGVQEIESSMVEVPLRILIDERRDGVSIKYKFMKQVYEHAEIEMLHESVCEIIKAVLILDLAVDELLVKQNYARNIISNDFNFRPGIKDIKKVFRQNCKDHQDEIFLIDENREDTFITWAKAAEYVDLIKRALYEKYLEAGGKNGMFLVGLKLRRTCYLPLACLACLELGAVWVPVSIDESKERTDELSEYLSVLLEDEWFDRIVDQGSPRDGDKADELYIGNAEGNTHLRHHGAEKACAFV